MSEKAETTSGVPAHTKPTNPFAAQGHPALSVEESLQILRNVGHAANGNFADHMRIQQALWVVDDAIKSSRTAAQSGS